MLSPYNGVMRAISFVALATLFILAGCGGGSSGSSTVPPSAEFGGTQIRLAGQMTNEIASSAPGGLAVFGFTGAITKTYWSDATPTTEDGEIVVGAQTPRGAELLAFDTDGTNQRTILTLSSRATGLAVSPDGVWLYFIENSVLKRIPMAGGVPAAALISDVTDFCLTPSGNKLVVFRPTLNTISVANANGSGLSDRATGVSINSDIIGASTENTAYVVTDLQLASPLVYEFPLSGALNSQLIASFSSTSLINWVLDAKRENIYFFLYDSLLTKYLWSVMRLGGPTNSYYILRDDFTGNTQMDSMTFTPDNSKILMSDATSEAIYATFMSDRLSPISRPILLTREDTRVAFAASPTFRTLVGSGNYVTGAAAVLFTEKSNRTPAVVLADCTTRTSMTLTRVSDDNDGTLIYRLECDNLTKLHYTKSNSFAQVSVIGGITGLKGAFVAFNAETGRVSNVVTFTKKPTVSRSPQGWVVEGEGVAEAYDGEGVRRPTGPKTVLR